MDENQLFIQKLKAVTHSSIKQFVSQSGYDLTESAIGGLCEIYIAWLSSVGEDLEAFSKHAKRVTIKPKDVILSSRRNENMHEKLEQWCIQNSLTGENAKKRKATKKL